ncbi:putative permease [Escherichia coli]|uniref:Putative permease n=1 Tax=Escherichia coli TaxID=562 RepID=A0A376WSV1_ECOLX|nr:putative permease [Escherichia coli]
MILSQTVDQDNNRLTDALIYTSTAIEPAFSAPVRVDVVDPSPEKPTVMLHNGTAYLIDHQGRDDNEQIYRNLQLHLNPLDQSPNVKRKAEIGHGAGALRLSSRSCRTAMAAKPWPDRIVDGAAGHFIKSG